MELIKFINSDQGSIAVSILFGLALAGLFRQTCKTRNCIVVKGPKMAEVKNKIYRIDNKCFKYIPYVVECEKNSIKTS